MEQARGRFVMLDRAKDAATMECSALESQLEDIMSILTEKEIKGLLMMMVDEAAVRKGVADAKANGKGAN